MVNMSQGQMVPNLREKPSRRPKLFYYLGSSLFLTTVLACLTGVYLQVAPKSYSSGMTLNLPSVSSSTRVDVPGLGATSVQSVSPYASSQDPRENYKIIAMSDQVLEKAAELMKLSAEEMGQPKVKVVDGSTVMNVEFLSSTAEEARQKTQAFYYALEIRLDELRLKTASEREKAIQQTIANSKEKLRLSQQEVADYRAETGLSSAEQLSDLASNIENLRRQRAELLAEQTQADIRSQDLRDILAMTPQEASNSLELQADPIFQEALQRYSEVTTALVDTEAIYQSDYPAVQQERYKQQELKQMLKQRAVELTGQADINQFNVSKPSGSPAREVLVQDLLVSDVNTQGLKARIETFDQQIQQLESKLATLAQSQSQLDALQRDMQIAETVFSSKLAQLDVSNSNVYDAYPKMQLLAGPSLADSPVSPKRSLAIFGLVAGALLLNSGSLTLWAYHRKNWRQKHGLEGKGFSQYPELA